MPSTGPIKTAIVEQPAEALKLPWVKRMGGVAFASFDNQLSIIGSTGATVAILKSIGAEDGKEEEE
jgi:hypothetical protein